jgi:hypothetical protein
VYESLYSGAATEMDATLGESKGAILCTEVVAWTEEGTEGEWIWIRVRLVYVVLWFESGRRKDT